MSTCRDTQQWLAVPIGLLILVLACQTSLCAEGPHTKESKEPLPRAVESFVAEHCFECHSGSQPEAQVQLEVSSIDWSESASVLWERVYDALAEGKMPPPGSKQPSAQERKHMVMWLERKLLEHSSAGGTLPRRLNRNEYVNTLRVLFDLPDFEVPDAFPADDSTYGFDNVGEGLVLSPPLMAQYLQVATSVADEVLPPDRGPIHAISKTYEIGASGLGTDKGAGAALAGEALRLTSSRNMASAAAWTTRFEAPQSGVYRLRIEAGSYTTDNMFYDHCKTPLCLAVYARQNGQQVYDPFGKLRKLAQFDVQPASANKRQTFSCDIELFQGEIFGLRWENGPAYSDPPSRLFSTGFLAERLTKNRRFYAAILKFDGGPRGTTQEEFYDAIMALMSSDGLDVSAPHLDELPEVWGGGLANAPHNWIKTFVLEELHRHGPALDVKQVAIAGPLRLIEDQAAKVRRIRSQRFLGQREADVSDQEFARTVLARFLPRLFRRPVSKELLQDYLVEVMRHVEENSARVEDGLHLAVRRALVSPNFLYRDALRGGRLDEFDLASRLSFFLTSSPPDDLLWKVAQTGELLDPQILQRETLRLLDSPRSHNFVRSFAGQWLGTRLLKDIMPDPRLLKFSEADREALILETELFFGEILRENHPLETFIDPDFSYRNSNLNKIYGGDLAGGEMQRITFERGGRQGGVLGLASVMMATANGVDTHPVLRGVWLLENVLGTPTPPPPGNVPAIAPDTSGTTTIRAQLDDHRADPSCAHCHQHIDPLGMVLEHFDPVGRWRDNYPVYREPVDGSEKLKKEFYSTIGQGTLEGPAVDAVGIMPDGTRLKDVTKLKAYVLEHIDMFSRCLTEKLLVYATGRKLSFGDRQFVDQIVSDVREQDNGFRDLILAIVQSDSFSNK